MATTSKAKAAERLAEKGLAPIALGVDEAAAMLGISPNLLRKNIEAWGIPHVRLESVLLFSASLLTAWFEGKALAAVA